MKRLRKEKRKIPIRGINEDKGKYFRCWNCGFICDSQRDALGQYGGVTTGTYVDTDGVTKYYPIVQSGCAFCGSTNYK